MEVNNKFPTSARRLTTSSPLQQGYQLLVRKVSTIGQAVHIYQEYWVFGLCLLSFKAMDELGFSNTDLIFHLNYMPRVCCFETASSTVNRLSRLECGFTTAKFKSFIRTASSESVTACFKRLRINFLESEA
jgi:hypothetical protein